MSQRRLLLKSLAFAITLACALASSSAYAASLDTTNADGSIKTFGFIGHPTYDFSRFTVLTSGDLDDVDNTLTGPSLVDGSVGIGGKGNFSMSDGKITRDVYMNQYGKFKKSGPAQVNGSLFLNQDTVLNNALDGARYLSDQAANDMSTGSYTVTQGSFNGQTENGNQNVTLLGGPGKIVLNLQDFVMTGGTFTLQGTMMTTFIINVSRNFSLNNSSVILAGQLMASHVLFNIKGSGSQVSLNQGTQLSGILLAAKRKVSLSGGKVFGKVIAEQLALTSGGQVISQ